MVTLSPVVILMKFFRIFPDIWARSSWPFSRRTVYMVAGKTFTTVPSASIASFLGINISLLIDFDIWFESTHSVIKCQGRICVANGLPARSTSCSDVGGRLRLRGSKRHTVGVAYVHDRQLFRKNTDGIWTPQPINDNRFEQRRATRYACVAAGNRSTIAVFPG